MRESTTAAPASSTHPARAGTRGFTLVELLVVIGIIALLISILLPALNKAREQAKTATCASNMRSALQAVHIYITESRGWLPGPHTSGAIWRSGGLDAIGVNEISSDETPLQNMDWVSPSFGKTFKWPENDYERLKTIFNVQLRCPSNEVFYTELALNNESLPPPASELYYSSYSAVVQFHAYPAREAKPGTPRIVTDMYQPAFGGVSPPAGYAPQFTKVGSSAKKVFLVEGSRYLRLSNVGTFNASSTNLSFNAARYQIAGGNFMIGGPYMNADDTPFQLYQGNSLAYTSRRLSPAAKNYAWRHRDRMNLGFFDGHVELRAPSESIQVELYVPKGSRIIDRANTYDPNDTDNQLID